MNQTTSLKVEKTIGYIWRVWSWGQQSGHADVTGWNVVDADSGELISGGFVQGGNTRSGYAQIARKRDAQAFVNGFQAFERGEYSVDMAKAYAKSFKRLGPFEQDELQGHFVEGAYVAERRAIRRARKAQA